jgi:hypothetical protein
MSSRIVRKDFTTKEVKSLDPTVINEWSKGRIALREALRMHGEEKWTSFDMPKINGQNISLSYIQCSEAAYQSYAKKNGCRAEYEYGAGANGPLMVDYSEAVNWIKYEMQREIVAIFADDRRIHRWFDSL